MLFRDRIGTLDLSVALLLLCLASCRSPDPSSPKQIKQDPFIQVYFNDRQSSSYIEPYRQQTRSGDNLETEILSVINTAKSSIVVAVQELKLPGIAQALVKQQQAGVKVRVILENTYARSWSNFTPAEIEKLPVREKQRYAEFVKLVDLNGDGVFSQSEIQQRDALFILRQAKIPIVDDTDDGSKGSGLMHHKFIVADNRTVIVTSANFTHSDIFGDFSQLASRGNANNLLKITSPELASLFNEEFNLMWGDGAGGKPDSLFGVKKPFREAKTVNVGGSSVTVQFSPTSKTIPWIASSNGAIAQTVSGASRQVDLALFVFSDQNVANYLELSQRKGAKIRVLVDRDFAYRPYSEALDLMGIAIADNCQYEPSDRPWQSPLNTVGVPILPPGDLLHHKFGVIDGEIVITGSHNWSSAANYNNDEALLIIRNRTVAAHFQQEFDRLYANSQLGIPKYIQTKIAADKQCLPQATNSVSNQRVNLNTATVSELIALPGVGEKLAQRIVAARPLRSLDDLDKVPGVGGNLKRKLSDRVTF